MRLSTQDEFHPPSDEAEAERELEMKERVAARTADESDAPDVLISSFARLDDAHSDPTLHSVPGRPPTPDLALNAPPRSSLPHSPLTRPSLAPHSPLTCPSLTPHLPLTCRFSSPSERLPVGYGSGAG